MEIYGLHGKKILCAILKIWFWNRRSLIAPLRTPQNVKWSITDYRKIWRGGFLGFDCAEFRWQIEWEALQEAEDTVTTTSPEKELIKMLLAVWKSIALASLITGPLQRTICHLYGLQKKQASKLLLWITRKFAAKLQFKFLSLHTRQYKRTG